MSRIVSRMLNFLLGPPPVEGEGAETTLVHTWPWASWLTLLLALLMFAVVAAIYWRERRRIPGSWCLVLAGLRMSIVALTIFLMYGWMQQHHRTDLPDLVVLLDVSSSMQTVDSYAAEEQRRRLAEQLQAANLEEATRINLAKLLLLERSARPLKELRDRYNVKLYSLGAVTRQLVSDDEAWNAAIRALVADQDASRLGDGLREILEAQRGRPTAAIVMLTDGVTTEGKAIKEVASYARQRAIPLHLVGLGLPRPPADLRLANLVVDEQVFAGDVVQFDFQLHAAGLAGGKARVVLRRDGEAETLAETEIEIRGDEFTAAQQLAYRPAAVGEIPFVVEVDAVAGETTTDNNRLLRTVTVRDEPVRVLYIQEYPNFDYRFIRGILNRERDSGPRTFELTTVLQEADAELAAQDERTLSVIPVNREELFAYDVIVFGDVNRSLLSRSLMQNLVDFVEQRGGGLVFVAGPRHLPLGYRDTPLERLFPFRLDAVRFPDEEAMLSAGYPLEPTALGIETPPLQVTDTAEGSRAVWQDLPGIRWWLEASATKDGVRVLARHPARTSATGVPYPLLTLQFMGAGRVVFLATDESYRWARYRGRDIYYQRFWVQLLRDLSRAKLLGRTRAAEMPADRTRYQRGEPVRLQVRFLDERLAPERDDGVVVLLEHAGDRRRRVILERVASRRGLFEATLTGLAEGDYRAWVAVPSFRDAPPSRSFVVEPPPGETARLELNADELREAAEMSRGRFYDYASARRLTRYLPRGRQVRIESLPPEPIWNSPWLAGLFVLLISADWLIRKRIGLP